MLKNLNNFFFYKKAVLISFSKNYYDEYQFNEYLDELSFLAITLKIKIISTFTQNISKSNKKTFFGKGKLKEIYFFLKYNNIYIVIFDGELSVFQLQNIEKILCCKVMDRNLLILDIFCMRAKTYKSKIQVELAKYQYIFPRLICALISPFSAASKYHLRASEKSFSAPMPFSSISPKFC